MSSARTNRPPVSNMMSRDKIVGIGLTIYERKIVAVLIIKLPNKVHGNFSRTPWYEHIRILTLCTRTVRVHVRKYVI